MTAEVEVVSLLARVFPSLQALPGPAQQERAEQLGVFLAQGWAVGAQGLQQRGLDVPPEAVASLAPVAVRVAQAKRGGTTFLAHVRAAVQDDARFGRLALALGGLFARSRPPSGGPTPVPGATPSRASGTFAAPPTPGAAPPNRTTGTFPVSQTPGATPPNRTTGTLPAPQVPGAAPNRTSGTFPAPQVPGAAPNRTSGTFAVPQGPGAAPPPSGSFRAAPPPAAPSPQAASHARATPAPPPAEGGFDGDSLADLDGSPSPPPRPRAAPTPAPVAGPDDLSGLDDLGATLGSAPPQAAEPPSAEAPAADDFLASLVGGGLAPTAPAPTPAPAPRPAAAPRPALPAASRGASPGGHGASPAMPGASPAAPHAAPVPASSGPGWDDFEKALASGEGLFKDDSEFKSGPAPAKAEKKPPAPRPPAADLDLLPDAALEGPAAPPPKAPAKPAAPAPMGGLDLLPEPGKDDEPQVDPRILAEPIAPAPAGNASRGNSGRLKKTMSGVRVEEFNLDSDDGPTAKKEEEEEPVEEAEPKDPAQAAVYRFERTGDPTALAEARRLFQETAAKAPHGTARAFAEAGLAKVLLLAGRGTEAAQQALASLERDPGNPFAIEVIVKVARGEAERAKLATGLAQGRTLVGMGRAADARRHLETKVAADNPDAPQPWLLLALIAKAENDDARFEQMLAQAWQRYPGKKHADLPLGGTIDIDLAAVLAQHGRTKWKLLDPEFLKRTVEAIDSKDNMAAGIFRLAVASARVGLARLPHLPRSARRKAWGVIGSSLIGLQYYDAAVEALDKASTMRPSEVEGKQLDNERRLAGQMRRAFDKPGVKAQMGKYKCLGVALLSQTTQERLAAAQKDRAAREAELLKEASEVATLCATSEDIRLEVRAAAEGQHREDPVIHIEVADAELRAVKDERTRLGDPSRAQGEKKGGLFSKIAGAAQAAADKVAQAAKDAQLKLKEAQAEKRRDEAVRKLGLVIAKELRDHPWKTPQLVAFAKRAATLEAFIDFHAEEERLAKVELESLAKNVG